MALECIQATPHIYSILLMIFLLYLQDFTHLNYLQNTLSSFSQHRRVYDRQPQALSGLTEFACKKDAYTIKVIIWHFETMHWFAFSLIVRWEDKCHVCDVVLSWFSMCCVRLLRKTGSGLQREKKNLLWNLIHLDEPSIYHHLNHFTNSERKKKRLQVFPEIAQVYKKMINFITF